MNAFLASWLTGFVVTNWLLWIMYDEHLDEHALDFKWSDVAFNALVAAAWPAGVVWSVGSGLVRKWRRR